jgi:bifunctional non-homologous end joining protein LigD
MRMTRKKRGSKTARVVETLKMTSAPAFIPPMLATAVRKLPEGPQWQYEVKWDGYRIEAMKHGTQVRLFSRRGHDFTKRFTPVADAISRLRVSSALLDGEVVAIDQAGRPCFQNLQNRASLPPGCRLVYYAFDLLNVNGTDLTKTPLTDRRKRLQKLLAGSQVRFSHALDGTPEMVVQVVRQHELEGVVAKRKTSLYQPGKRSGAWQKLPLKRQQRFVIGGYRPGLRNFEVLLVGTLDEGNFLFVGKVGQGLNRMNRAEVFKLIERLRIRECGFANLPSKRKGAFAERITAEEMGDYVWVKPSIFADIKFAEWTSAGVLRHAEFVAICTGQESQGAE